ncbi:DNA-binding protein [Priestia aryabhattai]|uniref:DNA-binding protein n=1 Tax=Priestia TaxID=2800373 RepID=UPI0012B80B55|nr:DNA-binding protein [Priestia megaterium]
MKEIEKYMTPIEAAYVWGIRRDSLKNKFSPSKLNKEKEEELNQMIEEGLIKFFLHPDRERKEWIISREAMIKWFGEPNNGG